MDGEISRRQVNSIVVSLSQRHTMEIPSDPTEELQYFSPTPRVPSPPPTYESDLESSDSDYDPNMIPLSRPKRGVEADNRKTKRRRFSDELCAQLCGLVQAGKTYRETAGLLGVGLSTVGTVFNRFMKTGSVSQRQRSGAPRKTTEQDDKSIVLFVKHHPGATQTEVRESVGLNSVSNATIARRVHELTDIRSFEDEPATKKPEAAKKPGATKRVAAKKPLAVREPGSPKGSRDEKSSTLFKNNDDIEDVPF